MVIDTPHLNLYQLRVFCTVARLGSFSRAAEELFISQPAISKYVQKLENELRADLVQTVGRRTQLTEAGRIVYDYARRIVELSEEAQRALQELEGLERGRVRIVAGGTPGVYLLPRIVATFRQRHPGVDIRMEITNSQRVWESMQEGLADLGFVGGPATGVLTRGLQVQPFVEDQLALITEPQHPLAMQTAIARDLLEHETFVLRETGSATRAFVEQELGSLGIAIRSSFTLTGCEAVKRAVMAGLGVSIVSLHGVTLETSQGALAVCKDPSFHFARPISIVARKDARLSAAALAFVTMVRKMAPPPLGDLLV